MIGAKRVTAPDGTTWQVGRRWLPDIVFPILVLTLELLIVLVLLALGHTDVRPAEALEAAWP